MKTLIVKIQVISIIAMLTLLNSGISADPNKKKSSISKPIVFQIGSYQFPQGQKAFADTVISYQAGLPEPEKKYQDPKNALSQPNFKQVGWDSFVSLGCRGSLTVKFTDNSLIDGEGNDLLIYEVGPSMEPTKVEISKNGSNWIVAGYLKGHTKAIDLKGKVNKGDIFYYVRLTDNKKGKCKKLKKGITIDRFDLTAGADIDAIASLNSKAVDSAILPSTPSTQVPTTPSIATQPVDRNIISTPVTTTVPPPAQNSPLPVPVRELKITSAKQVWKNNQYQIQVKLAKQNQPFSNQTRSAKLVYWGGSDPISINLSSTKKSKNVFTFVIPKNSFASANFAQSTGQYKIGITEWFGGDFTSNTLVVSGDQSIKPKVKISSVNGILHDVFDSAYPSPIKGYQLTLKGDNLPDSLVGEVWIMYRGKRESTKKQVYYSKKLTFSRQNEYTLVEDFDIEYQMRPRNGGYKIADTKFITEQFPGYYSGEIKTRLSKRVDHDGDGHGSIITGGDDCDDNDANRYPGNAEFADDLDHDEDCDYQTFGYKDDDNDGYHDASICNIDDSGFRICGTDCDDNNPGTHINQPDYCDGIDNNCDGLVDEGVSITFYKDSDRDRYGDPLVTRQSCRGEEFFEGAFWINNNTDCDDSDPNKNPAKGCD